MLILRLQFFNIGRHTKVTVAASNMNTKDQQVSKMDVSPFLRTERLLIKPLALTDDDFIFELVNTEGWIRFIGNRNIPSQDEARAYIQKVLENENVSVSNEVIVIAAFHDGLLILGNTVGCASHQDG